MKYLLEPKVHVLAQKNNQLLFLRRSNTGCYDGYWCIPAGRVEKNESPTDAARRETLEEVGLTIDPLFVATIYAKVPNIISKTPKDYEDLCFFFSGEVLSIPRNCEPKKHDRLEWFPIDNLPTPIMPVVKFGTDCFLKGKTFGEFGYV